MHQGAGRYSRVGTAGFATGRLAPEHLSICHQLQCRRPPSARCSWAWCLPTGFQSIIPYFYVIYFGVLLGAAAAASAAALPFMTQPCALRGAKGGGSACTLGIAADSQHPSHRPTPAAGLARTGAAALIRPLVHTCLAQCTATSGTSTPAGSSMARTGTSTARLSSTALCRSSTEVACPWRATSVGAGKPPGWAQPLCSPSIRSCV